jgi:hypothetical protein
MEITLDYKHKLFSDLQRLYSNIVVVEERVAYLCPFIDFLLQDGVIDRMDANIVKSEINNELEMYNSLVLGSEYCYDERLNFLENIILKLEA